MKLSRRDMIAVSAGAGLVAMGAVPVLASVEDTQKRMMDFTGGKKPETGPVSLTAPEIAENGNTVPITVEVDSPMSADSYVESVMLLAEGNPNPAVATMHFTPMSGAAAATTRIRLAKTQNVIAVAKMNDGSVFMDTKQVKVTIGGCGG